MSPCVAMSGTRGLWALRECRSPRPARAAPRRRTSRQHRSASGQLPASALVGIQRFPDLEEQDTLVDVQDDQTYGAAFEDRQILWLHTPSVPDRGCSPIVLVAAASIKGVISVGRLAPPKRSTR